VLLERSLHPQYVSNTYLVAGGAGGDGVLIDAGGPMEPLYEAIEKHGINVTHLLLTHHHHDHVSEAAEVKERYGCETVAHPIEAELIEGGIVDRTIEPGTVVESGGLTFEALHTPGHTGGMISFRTPDAVFTGDTLFKGSVGGVRAPGASGFADLKHSIKDVLMELPPETIVYPGHTDSTTVAQEWEENAFIRLWRGLDEEGADKCTVWGDEATLVLWAPDYDGGHKAWVRWADGSDDIVPGSQVEREGV
jgi:glyoxylase-like metal-dependent hydrolase (beta-lactamase superfamily II)